ncbi:esterase-like activity of phytase family protein [Rhodovibrio salinarum]|nr:esterase-like activity of phytase family protein [Rhodovibrio salinarum]
MLRLLPLLLVALLLALPARAESIQVEASPVSLHDDREVERIGALAWRAGYALTSDNPNFGGLSDLAFTAQGRLLIAGDKGYWVDARPTMTDGHLAGLTDVRMGAYRKLDGAPVTEGWQKDGESLTLIDGVPVVGFEQLHRLRAYPDGLDARATRVPEPEGLARANGNKGAEALTQLADGRLLLLVEARLDDGDRDYTGWLRGTDGTWRALQLARRAGYRPTGAAQLPGGDLVVLTRAYNPLAGARVRLQRIPLETVKPGARLDGPELAHFRAPYIVDNFEGVAARRVDGETRIYLLSDDNFNFLQRTLLLEFALTGE